MLGYYTEGILCSVVTINVSINSRVLSIRDIGEDVLIRKKMPHITSTGTGFGHSVVLLFWTFSGSF